MWKSCTNVFLNIRTYEQQKLNKTKKQKRGMSKERSTAGTRNKKSPNASSLPNQNTIINIISHYLIRCEKNELDKQLAHFKSGPREQYFHS